MSLRIALVQMICEKGALEQNLASTLAYIEEAEQWNVDIIAFPEASLSGYADPQRYPQAALTLKSPVVQRIIAETRGKHLTVLVGIIEANTAPEALPYLTHLVVRDGALLGTYRKMTLSDDEEAWHAVGDTVPIFRHDDMTFGISICADISNRAVWAQAAQQGAQLVFEVAAPGLYGEQATRNWRSGFEWWRDECDRYLSAYARKHRLWIAAATQAGRTTDEDFPGGAYVYAPDGRQVYASDNWSPGAVYIELK